MDSIQESAATAAKLLDVKGVANVLGCSPRQVYRLSEARRMPPPIRVGRLVRWSRGSLEAWIASGCPSCACRRRSRQKSRSGAVGGKK